MIVAGVILSSVWLTFFLIRPSLVTSVGLILTVALTLANAIRARAH